MAKISIIIPTYNAEQYIDNCIASWINQSLSDIEIIVVDDASTDSTPDILRKWKEKDSRVIVLTNTTKKSAYTARKVGVETAKGKYILFSEANGKAVDFTCKLLYKEMEKRKVDILHYNAKIIKESNNLDDDIRNLEDIIKPYKRSIKGENVFLGCFYYGQYKWNLWNKIFSAEVCKRLSEIQEENISEADEALTFFYLAYNANSYQYLLGNNLYNYIYDSTTKKKKGLDYFLQKCSCYSYTVHLMENFALSHNLSANYNAAINNYKKELIDECVHWLLNLLLDEEKRDGFDIIMDNWPHHDVIANLADRKIDKYYLAKHFIGAKAIKFQPQKINTIAAYYHSIGIGGAERVLCTLCKIWLEMGYHVIVVTDVRNKGYEFELPAKMERVVLSDYYNPTLTGYKERGKILYSIIKEKKIDILVYHDWMKDSMLWDELIIKSAGTAFVAHCHNTFTLDFHAPRMGLSNFVAPYLLADAVVTLDETDKTFWSNFNANVFTVFNPFTYNFEEWIQSECNGLDILWLARIMPEKRPFDTLLIMKEVLKTVPDAKLHIVGSSARPKYEKKLKKTISKMKLEKNVILYGAQTDVMFFYQKATLFLMTSEFEGFALTLQESMLSGLPVVMYDLPYLTLTRNNPSIISVEQENYAAASNAIIDLILDAKKRKTLGLLARKYIEQYKDYDFKSVWQIIFESVLVDHEFEVLKEQRDMMETLVTNQDYGFRKTKEATIYAHRKAIKFALLFIKFKNFLFKY